MSKVIIDDSSLYDIGNAIRTKSKEETLYKPNEMADAILNMVKLNFTVVGGAVQPTSPQENTIWVKTIVAIPGWMFSMQQPSSTTSGMVWIDMDNTRAATMDALRSDSNIVLNLTDVYQYANNEWTKQEAYVYQSGEWIEIASEIILFDNGDTKASKTGGWTVYNGNGTNGGGDGVVTNSHILVSYYGSGARDSAAYTVNMIDATPYTKLCATVNVTIAGNGVYLGLAQTAISYPAYGYYNASTKTTSTGSQTIKCDISGITSGKHYVAIYGDVAEAYIYKVWME